MKPINREGKVHPKLRMWANCDPVINQARAELVSTLSTSAKAVPMREAGAVPKTLGRREKAPAAKKRWQTDTRTRVNVFVELRHPDAERIPGEKDRQGTIAMAELSLEEARALAQKPSVAMVTPAEALKFSQPAQGRPAKLKPPSRKVELPKGSTPEPVLVGIIDVQGFDFTHADFLVKRGKKTETRFARIWDQGGSMRPPPAYKDSKGKARFAYGAEITSQHMNNAIANTNKAGIPARDIEPQSQMVPGSHGTHVASTAAGANGVCPQAVIAGVLISLPQEDLDRRKSFYDSSRLVDAVEYLMMVAQELGETLNKGERKGKPLPISINISLGTNGDAHDGSSPICRWIENALTTAGRCVSVAAGNAGQSEPSEPGDMGYVLGRIHTAGKIPSKGLTTHLEWTVVGNGRADISENELEIWYSAQDRFRVSILPPNSSQWIGPVDPRQYIQNKQLADGTFVSIYNEVYHPVNGANQIAIYLSPNLTPGNIIGIASGTWTVQIEGTDVRDGSFHGWIERDDPFDVGRVGDKEAWRFPSFFTEKTNVPVCQVSSLACSPRILSVANLDSKKGRIHVSSSQGPTRDGRWKPDVAALGTDVVAAFGFGDADSPQWIPMTGTSMASPYVAGVAALMLSVAPRLNAAQINGIMQRTARPLPGKTYQWATDAGFGIIDPVECLREAVNANQRSAVP
jgi:subtilisin family serine protease